MPKYINVNSKNSVPGFLLVLGSILFNNTYAQDVTRDWTIQVTTTVQTNPPAIIFNWVPIVLGTQVSIFRKAKTDIAWNLNSPIVTLAGTATSFTDYNVALDQDYEYFIRGYAVDANPYTYVNAGIEIAQVDYKGKIILLVDSTLATPLYTELNRLVADITGDGWQVIRHDVSPKALVPDVKAMIKNDYDTDKTNVKAVFIFGHVPVPYSGTGGWDGHPDHQGAWPADGYYADMTGIWTDNTESTTQASRQENWNVIGDGKFDQSYFPARTTLQIGRVDLSNMPAFPDSEVALLRQYLDKDHNFRHKVFTAEPRALVDNNFNLDGYDASYYASTGWRSFAAMFPPSQITNADYFTASRAGSYLWAYAAGGGSYSSAEGVGATDNFAIFESKVVFNMFFGSYFGDWDSPNNFLRAPLASKGWGLSNCWGYNPRWLYHHMALGENLGYSALITMRNTCYQSIDSTHNNANAALMGDPTLRMHTVAPAKNLIVSGTSLSWTASTEAVLGYCIYRQDTVSGAYTKIKTTGSSVYTYIDPTPLTDVNYYMVRALKLETSNSGSYFNLSQGIFGSSDKTPPSSPTDIVLGAITNTSIAINWTNSTDNGTVQGYEIYCDSVFAGFTSSNTFTVPKLTPSTQYAITVIAIDAAGNSSMAGNPLFATTTADILSPAVPSGLACNTPTATAFVLSWTATNDNIGVTEYEVYKDGVLYGTTTSKKLFIAGRSSETYSMTVKARDFAGNTSAASAGLSVTTAYTTGMYAYEGFKGSVNSGTGWGGKWSKNPSVTTSGLAFGALQVVGDKLGGTAINNMSRLINLGITDGDSLCIAYLCTENASDVNLILTSDAGGIALRNGRFQGDVVGAVQENSYSSYNIGGTDGDYVTPESVTGTLSFNLVVIKRTGAVFQLRRWIYTNPADLPQSMPVLGDAKAFMSGQYTSSDLRYIDITGINLVCKNGTAPVYYDEIRLGHRFEDVAPLNYVGLIEKLKLEDVTIYPQTGNIVTDLSGVSGSSVVTVIDMKGTVVKTVKSTGNEKLTISILNKGIYVLRVRNGGKSYSQKVILL